MNTWAVFVPLTQAAEARAVLRNQGEDSGIIHGLSQSRSDMRATLGFFAAVIAGCTLFAIFLAVREAW
jgi:hypothetical protein